MTRWERQSNLLCINLWLKARWSPAQVRVTALLFIAVSVLLAVPALAWLDGLRLPESRRVLLGYVEVPAVPAGVSLRFYGASANTADGSELRLMLPAPSSSLRPR